MPKMRDLTGERFARLIGIRPVGVARSRQIVWLFACDCGGTAEIIGASVVNSRTRSCGCLHREVQREKAIKRNIARTGTPRGAAGWALKPKPKPHEKGVRTALRDVTVAHRFWSKVTVGDIADCWPWQKQSRTKEYGSFGVGHRRQMIASRMAWTLMYGEIPEGLHILHLCDNPPCCNPAHLYAGTVKDNVHDMLERGRHVNAYGPTSGRAARR